MTRLKRSLLLGATVVLLLLAVVGAWLWVPTRNALLRAESFQFRRMLVTQVDEAYRFFFVTNRTVTEDGDRLEYRFGNQRQDQFTFGSFDTRIEPTLGVGMIINPSDWFRDEEIRLSNIELLERSDVVEQLG